MHASLFVTRDVYSQAEKLLKAKQGKNVLQAVELLLQNDLAFSINDKENLTVFSVGQKVDAGALLQDGLSYLQSKPFEVLDIPLGAQTMDVRKAYKKCALKYHPDKNPRTTALFQCIQTASDRLSDRDARKIEENRQKSSSAASCQQRQQPTKQPTSDDFKKPTQPPPAPSTNYSNPKPTTHASSSSSQVPRKDPFNPFSHQSSNQNSNYNNDAELARKAKEARDKREAQMKEYLFNLERARQHKEDILKEAQKAFNAQREEAKEKFDARAAKQAAPSASYGKSGDTEPTPTPDSYRYRGDSKAFLRGYKGNNNIPVYDTRSTQKDKPTSSIPCEKPKIVPNKGNIKPSTTNSPPHVTGTTFTVNSKGDVRMNGGSMSSKTTAPSPTKPSNLLLAPKPSDLRSILADDTVIELEWTAPSMPSTALKLLFEFNWRNVSLGHVAWEKTTSLLTSHICRKKNLMPSTTYEFRVRSVVELPGGMLGDRSEWTRTIVIQTKESTSGKKSSSSNSNSSSNSTSNSNSSSSSNSKPKLTPSKVSSKINENIFSKLSGVKIDDEESDYDFQYYPVIDTWLMSYDSSSGHYYYYNESTGESQWEAPEWVEEDDTNTGAKYYVKLDKYSAHPMHSTWSRPKDFAKLVRPT